MDRQAPVCVCVLALLVCAAGFAQSTAYVRGGDGRWRAAAVQAKQGRVTLTVQPTQPAGGAALVVINKPPWMVLEDGKPPILKGLKVNGVAVDAAAESGLVLSGPTAIAVTVADDLNPIDVASIRLVATPPLPAVKIDAPALKPPAKSGTFTLSLPALAPGFYDAVLTVPDLSPQGNALTVPLKISVLGATASADKQTIRVAARGAGFTLTAQPHSFLQVGDSGQTLFLTSQVKGEYVYIQKITGVEELVTTHGGERCYRVSATAGDTDGKESKVKADLQFDLRARPDLPCLLVTGRTINQTADDSETYCFWGWPGGDGFVTDKGPQEWKMQYADIGPVKWVFLPATEAGKPGIGIISPLNFGESRFGTLLMYTIPQHLPTKLGGAVETPFAIMPAKSADEVQAVAAKVWAAAGWGK